MAPYNATLFDRLINNITSADLNPEEETPGYAKHDIVKAYAISISIGFVLIIIGCVLFYYKLRMQVADEKKEGKSPQAVKLTAAGSEGNFGAGIAVVEGFDDIDLEDRAQGDKEQDSKARWPGRIRNIFHR